MEKIGAVKDFPANTMTEVEVNDKHVLVVNNDGKFYVTAARCPHMNGRLAHGTLDGIIITCPVHGSQFNVKTGEVIRWTNLNGALLAAAKKLRHPRNLKTYQATRRDGFLFIGDSDE